MFVCLNPAGDVHWSCCHNIELRVGARRITGRVKLVCRGLSSLRCMAWLVQIGWTRLSTSTTRWSSRRTRSDTSVPSSTPVPSRRPSSGRSLPSLRRSPFPAPTSRTPTTSCSRSSPSTSSSARSSSPPTPARLAIPRCWRSRRTSVSRPTTTSRTRTRTRFRREMSRVSLPVRSRLIFSQGQLCQ